jgi:hypothetical protein
MVHSLVVIVVGLWAAVAIISVGEGKHWIFIQRLSMTQIILAFHPLTLNWGAVFFSFAILGFKRQWLRARGAALCRSRCCCWLRRLHRLGNDVLLLLRLRHPTYLRRLV